MGAMLRWIILLCIGIFLVFALGPESTPPTGPQTPERGLPARTEGAAFDAVELDSGEVWEVSRVIELDGTSPQQAASVSPATPSAPQTGTDPEPGTADQATAIEAALSAAQEAVTRPQTTPVPAPRPVATAAPEPAAEPAPEPAPIATPDPVATVLFVTGTRVNLRAGPSTDNAIVTALVQGTAVEWVGEAPDGWLEIRDTLTGAQGFMSGDFLSPTAP